MTNWEIDQDFRIFLCDTSLTAVNGFIRLVFAVLGSSFKVVRLCDVGFAVFFGLVVVFLEVLVAICSSSQTRKGPRNVTRLSCRHEENQTDLESWTDLDDHDLTNQCDLITGCYWA